MSPEVCRIDVWLWRARLFKTRSLAGAFAAAGRIRLTRDGVESRLDKASRLVRKGDQLVFVLGGKALVLIVERMGERRGPAQEARTLYSSLASPNIETEDGVGG